MKAPSVRERMLQVREEAIIDAVNRLLADKGYDLMTVDQVAADVGIAKASLYKHFPSKEALAAAAMVRVMQRARDFLQTLVDDPERGDLQRLRAAVRWAMAMQYDGAMPSLPSENSSLRAVLASDRKFMDLLMQISDILGAWIVSAQQAGQLHPGLPPEVMLFTVFARACDSVLPVLKATGAHSREQVLDWMMATCFDGIGVASRAPP